MNRQLCHDMLLAMIILVSIVLLLIGLIGIANLFYQVLSAEKKTTVKKKKTNKQTFAQMGGKETR